MRKPLARRLLSALRRTMVSPVDAIQMRRLARACPPFAKALDRSLYDPIYDEIERARLAMEGDDSPLVDGTAGTPGIYDGGEKTISQAVAASKSAEHGRFLYRITHAFKPMCAIELGTNVGISGSYIAAGLPPAGELTTFESSPYRLRRAKDLHRQLKLDNIRYQQGLFADTLAPALKQLPPIEMAFIDGHHQYQPTLDYFETIRQHCAEHCVFVFDDIPWSEGMRRAWTHLRRHPSLQVAADLWSMGVCIVGPIGGRKPYRTLPIPHIPTQAPGSPKFSTLYG